MIEFNESSAATKVKGSIVDGTDLEYIGNFYVMTNDGDKSDTSSADGDDVEWLVFWCW